MNVERPDPPQDRPSDNYSTGAVDSTAGRPVRVAPSGGIVHPADEPQVHIHANESWRGLVHLGIGTGQTAYNITPDRADELAAELIAAAAAARAGAR